MKDPGSESLDLISPVVLVPIVLRRVREAVIEIATLGIQFQEQKIICAIGIPFGTGIDPQGAKDLLSKIRFRRQIEEDAIVINLAALEFAVPQKASIELGIGKIALDKMRAGEVNLLDSCVSQVHSLETGMSKLALFKVRIPHPNIVHPATVKADSLNVRVVRKVIVRDLNAD